ncbi:MAG: hypothetical protein JSW27_18770 [Phycisphaerales bacterium]|nr:MAG: hypothetical protein JSW27_18770 [Phycisphaerales bacterium]
MEGQSQNERGGARSAKTRKWPWILAGGLAIIVLAVALTPVYLSSNSFKRMIQAKIGRSTGGTAAIGELTVGWLKGVRISEFSFRDKAGRTSVSIGGIDAQPRLRALLGGTLSLGETTIDKPNIEIDLRKKPSLSPATAEAGRARPTSAQPASLALISDVVINDGSVRVTDRAGKTMHVANLNSQLSMRPPGEASNVKVDMVIADAGDEAQIHATGTVTPSQSSGWTLKGTSGDVVVEVNDLKLDSLAPLFDLAGVELQATGRVSANMNSTLYDGKLGTVAATIAGQDLDIGGAVLKGDRFHTSRLDVRTKLTQNGQAIRIEQLEARTDWATVKAAGTLPLTVKSMADLLESDSAYDLQGDFDCELPALLSQMPNTFALKEGTRITAGRANGTISTITQNGHATIVAQTKVVGLAGNVEGRELTLVQPVEAGLRLSADGKKTRLEALNVSSAFAQIEANGDFEQIRYDARIDLTALQSELGQFADIGPYQMAGTVSSQGQVSIQDSNVVATGAAALSQLLLASVDGNSVSEPQANVDFALNMDRTRQSLTIDHVDIKGGFGDLSAHNGTVPLGETSSVPMKVDVTARELDLAKLKPYAVLFASFPKDMDLAGIAQSEIAITGQKGKYRLQTADTKIQNLKLVAPEKEPFEQEQVALLFDVQVDPNAKAINVEKFELESPQIKIRKGQFEKTRQGNNAQVQGTIEGECDWAAVGSLASGFLPAGLDLTGQRPVALNFASTYPADDPNLLLANLDATTTSGFDGASYKGLNVGPTDLDIRMENGLMTITPFKTTVNNGQLNFAAQADFKEKSRSLQTPEPMMLAQGIQLNREMTAQMLQYVNPLFANVTGISGVASFECERLSIPLAGGMAKEAVVIGTISADNVLLEASGLLEQILKATGQSLRGQRLTIRPTRIALQNGTMQYDDMQIDVGDNPINFGGTIGLDERLDMTVTLPWTLRGRTARVDREDRAGPRIQVALTGTITKPKLDLGRLLQDQIFRGLESLF